MSSSYKYQAFISYSHKDEKWASWLHRSLETFKIPKYLVGESTSVGTVPEQIGKVFRDREELSSSHSLGTELTQALTDSACQIVICSPNAANSHWTNEEILTYKRLGREDRIFCLIVEGEPGTDTECFPPAVRFQMGADGVLSDRPAEPIAADARPHADGKKNAKLKLISGMLGVGFDALKRREQQRRQKRMAVITASAVAGMVVAISLATMAILARNDAEVQRERAEAETEIARETKDFMVGLFEVSDPSEALGNSITAREILDKGAERIGTELGDQPQIQATLMDTMGEVYTSLGLYPQASVLLEDSLRTRQEKEVGTPTELANTMDNLADVLGRTADYDRALEIQQESLEIREGLDNQPSIERRLQKAETLTGMADLLSRKGDDEAALPLILESLAIRRAIREPVHADIAENLEDLGLNYYDRGDYDTAIEHLQAAVDMRRELISGPYPATSAALSNLALVHADAGNYEAAETLYSEALEMDRSYFGDKHPELSANINNLAYLYHDKGDLESAEKFYRQAIAMDEELLGPDNPGFAVALSNLAFLLHDMGRTGEAIAMQANATEILDKAYGEAHPQLASALSGLGFMLNEEKDYAAAEPHLVRALSMRRKLLGADNPEVGKSLLTIATLHLDTGKYELAEKEASQAYELLRSKIGEEHWLTGAALSAYGAALAEQEKYAEAEDTLIRAHATLIESGNAMPVFVEATVVRITELYRAIGQPDKADQYLEQN